MNIGNLPGEEATGVLYPVLKNSSGLSLVLKHSGTKRAMGAALVRMLQVYENGVSWFFSYFPPCSSSLFQDCCTRNFNHGKDQVITNRARIFYKPNPEANVFCFQHYISEERKFPRRPPASTEIRLLRILGFSCSRPQRLDVDAAIDLLYLRMVICTQR
jgi:hypothetical protein